MSSAVHPQDLASLASELGFAPQNLYSLVHLGDNLYHEVKIPKRGDRSEYRTLVIPSIELKGVQREILNTILSKNNVSKFSYAYQKGKSVPLAAKKLAGNKAVLKVDIKNFFPSISAKRVFGIYKDLGYKNTQAWILTQLCTYNDALCQGAPTSPYLSNLICRGLDENLGALAHSWGLEYIRYSDDMFFISKNDFRHKLFKNYVRRFVSDHGFRINHQRLATIQWENPVLRLGWPRMALRQTFRGRHGETTARHFFAHQSILNGQEKISKSCQEWQNGTKRYMVRILLIKNTKR